MKQAVAISTCCHWIKPWTDPNISPPVEMPYTHTTSPLLLLLLLLLLLRWSQILDAVRHDKRFSCNESLSTNKPVRTSLNHWPNNNDQTRTQTWQLYQQTKSCSTNCSATLLTTKDTQVSTGHTMHSYDLLTCLLWTQSATARLTN